MTCSGCGAALAPQHAFCPICGTPVGAAAGAPFVVSRPGIVTLLATLQFLGGAFWLLVSLFVGAASRAEDSPDALIGAVILGGIGGLQILCGVGLWTLKPYGRILQIVFAGIGLLGIPIGTLIAIAILVYLYKPGVKLLFSGRPATEFTQAERAEIAVLARHTTATVIIVAAVCVVGGVAALGILAAVAVPGLLRARMAGNEAAAISRLRSIGTAEVTYVTTCGNGGYADSFTVLATSDPKTTAVVSPDIANLAMALPGGYEYTLSAGAGAADGPLDCHGRPTRTSWYATAVPVTPGTTGARAFAVSSDLVIWQLPGAKAPAEPFGPPAVAITR